MPIRDENKARYPADWKAISKRVREQAGHRCETCGVKNGEEIIRLQSEDYAFEPIFVLRTGDTYSAEDGRHLGWHHAPDLPGKWVKVVLTVAHLDHTPENCADSNLRALCQRCHNIYDMPMRRAGIKQRARERLAAKDMFQ